MNKADTAWMVVATALVMIMTPTLAFFYGGLVRKKNVLSILMQCFVILAVVSLQWILFGYSLAFGPDKGGIIGGLDFVFLNNVGLTPKQGMTIPHQLFMMFQMMFAVITPALIIGAFAERIKFSGFIVFTLLWTTLIYDPMAHWVWGGGWLSKMEKLAGGGTLDFAGGTVIHITAGISALVFSLLIGKRTNAQNRSPHNLPFAVLGAGFLWFGWFGFNAGSQLAIDSIAISAFVNTNTAAAAAALTWLFLDWKIHGVPTVLGVITGIVAGLVAITPAAGYVTPMSAIAIGICGSILGFIFVTYVKARYRYDDSLDVFGVHGIAGIAGALLTGVFATKAINPASSGAVDGNWIQLLIQLISVVIAILFSAAGTWIIYKIIDKTIGMRVEKKEEYIGLDLTQHHEAGYTLVD